MGAKPPANEGPEKRCLTKEASDGSAEQINCCSSLGVSRTPPACLQQSRGGSSRKDMQMTVCAHASSDKGEVYNDGVTVSCVEI